MKWFSLHLKIENINSHLQYLPNNFAEQTLVFFLPSIKTAANQAKIGTDIVKKKTNLTVSVVHKLQPCNYYF